ncbi:MAG: type II toxin-antitoxin system death-on-curing family toxin [Sporichthyaceae bacterium]
MTDEQFDHLDYSDALAIAARVLPQVLIRDAGLIASALARPQMTVFGADAYPELPDKAAALLHGLAGNHGLVDGNKRLAWACARMFLGLNGFELDLTEDQAVDLVLGVAAGEVQMEELGARIRQAITPLK